jgi:hypothetical protein
MARLAVRLAIAAVGLLVAFPAAGAAAREPSTPELIAGAAAAGRVGHDRATLLLAQAIGDPASLPAAYRSRTPWDGTLVLARLRHAVPAMRDAALRGEARRALAPAQTGCLTSQRTLSASAVTAHFHISYAPGTLGGGLGLGDWGAALESAWATEVTAFGWASPPVLRSDPAPGERIPVRLDPGLAPGLYGFVSTQGEHAGFVGDNPSTPWTEVDAQAVCMVLRSDYSGFGSPAAALQATAAHEFNHAIQAGYLDIFALDAPSDTLIEGTATWMEDEAADAANDVYHYLWPDVSQSMLRFQPLFPYPYWVVYRALTEPFGTTVPGGGEDVMQSTWETLSRRLAGELDALDAALRGRARTLDDAFHDAAVAMRFARPCTPALGAPFCLEEADAYVAAAERPEDHAALTGPGDLAIDLEDGLSAAFVALPAGLGPFSLRVANGSPSPGDVRGTVACDLGGGLRVARVPAAAGPGGSAALASFDPAGCGATVAVLTTSRTGEGPRPVTLTLGPPIPQPVSAPAASLARPAETELRAELRLAGSQRLRRARIRGVLAELGCSHACTLRWRLEVSRAERRRLNLPRRRLGRGRVELAAGPARPLRLALDRRVARRLASARTVRFRLFVLATDAQGRRTGAEARGRLRR